MQNSGLHETLAHKLNSTTDILSKGFLGNSKFSYLCLMVSNEVETEYPDKQAWGHLEHLQASYGVRGAASFNKLKVYRGDMNYSLDNFPASSFPSLLAGGFLQD